MLSSLFLVSLLAATPHVLARDPLHDTTTIFLTALTTNSPSLLQSHLSPSVTYTENTTPLPLFTGFWKRISPMPVNGSNLHPVYQHSHADFDTAQIATVTTLLDDGKPVIYTVRLRLDELNKITEVEGMIVNYEEGVGRYASGGWAEDGWGVWSEGEEHGSGGVGGLKKDRLVELAKGYYNNEDSSGLGVDTFGAGCIRLENGRELASCAVQAPARRGKAVVRERRFVVQGRDVQRQSVFCFAMMDVVARNTAASVSWYGAEGFRFNGAEKVDRIETTWVEVPYGSEAPFGSRM